MLVVVSLVEISLQCAPGGSTADVVIASTASLSMFAADVSRLATTTTELRSVGPFTIFAPSDSAYLNIPIALRSEMDALTATRETVIQSHIIKGALLDSASLTGIGIQQSMQGLPLALTPTTVNAATILQSDICGSNSVIHSINRVLIPPALGFPANNANLLAVLAGTRQHALFVGMITTLMISSLFTETTRVKTILAPVDSAFQPILNQNMASEALILFIKKLLIPNEYMLTSVLPSTGSVTTESGEILSYVSGVFGSATAVQNNIKSSNGIIHSVSSIPVVLAVTQRPTPQPIVASLVPVSDLSKSVIQLLSSQSVWATFYSVVTSPVLSGVTGSLFGGVGPMTVFAPTEQAWNKIPQGVKEYLNDNFAAMQELLDYHLVIGTSYRYSGLLAASPLITYGGTTLVATATTTSTVLGQDKNTFVTYSDIESYNGIIHGIEKVLQPPGMYFPTKTIADIANESNDLSISAELLSLVSSSLNLYADGSMTAFLPVNEAWNKLITGQLAVLRNDPVTLLKLLQHHLIGVYRTTADMLKQSEIISTFKIPDNVGWKTDLGGNLIVKIPSDADSKGGKFWNNVFDLRATNGIVHGIDTVLLPPDTTLPSPKIWGIISGTSSISMFADFCRRLSYDTTIFNRLGRVNTVFAPSNNAFNQLPSGILNLIQSNNTALGKIMSLFIIEDSMVLEDMLLSLSPFMCLEGSRIIVQRAVSSIGNLLVGLDSALSDSERMRIGESDLKGTDGVIHITDKVILPTAERAPQIPRADTATLLNRLRPLQDFVVQLSNRGLLPLLQRSGPVTVFAPNTDAIAKAQQGWNTFLENDSKMERVLRHHIANNYLSDNDIRRSSPGAVATSDDGSSVTERDYQSLAATAVTYSVQDGSQKILLNGNQATIIDTIPTLNGVIHVIDGLLVPPSLVNDLSTTDRAIATVMEAYEGLSIFTRIIKASALDVTLLGPGPFTIFAPTDNAFKDIPSGQLHLIETRADVGASLVEYHTARQGIQLMSADLISSSPINVREGGQLQISSSQVGDLVINGQARISAKDIMASNGVIHEIDSVLFNQMSSWVEQLPASSAEVVLSSMSSLSIFNEIINMCGEPCTTVLQNNQNTGLTVFAPTDAAIRSSMDSAAVTQLRTTQRLSQRMFFTHVADEIISSTLSVVNTGSKQEQVRTKDGMIVTTGLVSGLYSIISPQVSVVNSDNFATNGVVHSIASTLTLPSNTTAPVALDMTPLGSTSDDDFPLVIIVVVCVGIFCLLVAIAIFCVCRRLRGNQRQDGLTAEQDAQQKEKEFEIQNTPGVVFGEVNQNPLNTIGFATSSADIESVVCKSEDSVLRPPSMQK